MNIQRVNMFSSKNIVNSAEKLSKVNFTSSLLKSDSKDSFSKKLMSCGGDTDISAIWGAFGFAC